MFTVGARGTKLKVECRVYKSQRAMLVAARQLGVGIGNDTAAVCEGSPSIVPKGKFAIIFFCKPHITKGVVAHEMDHAAFCLLSRRKKKTVDFIIDGATDAEETHATIVGDLVDAFHKAYGV